ncbi:hypothetical protein [Octadecabacter sp. R77987]|uniref:hypothetical protein n=1 Tax=Octadecabacter sp. R77987 TaxID=3093874 RepID=UPI00366FFC4B
MRAPGFLAGAIGRMGLRDHLGGDLIPDIGRLRQKRRHRIFQIPDQNATHQLSITSARAGPAP